MNIPTIDHDPNAAQGCCGGPPPAGTAACCALDATAKANGESGCGCGTSAADEPTHDEMHQAVREQYSQVAQRGGGCGTTESTCCGTTAADSDALSLAMGYSPAETGAVPAGANMGLGCGNPQAIAALRPGESVLDLGSGGGFDCFLAARQVGDEGNVIGVDMTPAMISKARGNAVKAGYRNVEFRLGEIESLPVADASIDAIISNCVINLSPDKPRVFAEAFRVLKPGGRLAVADIVAFADIPEAMRRDMTLLTGCMSGASLVAEIEAMLTATGFTQIRVAPKDESRSLILRWAPDQPIMDYVISATIEAIKPAACVDRHSTQHATNMNRRRIK